MDSYRLIIAPQAAIDLAAIHDAIAKDSPQNAVAVATRIMDALELLREVPHRTVLATQPRELKHPVRSVVVRPYVIYFRAVDDEKMSVSCAFVMGQDDLFAGLTEPVPVCVVGCAVIATHMT